MPTLLEVITAILGAVFGVGVAWASLKGKVHAADLRASTATEQAQDALGRIADLRIEFERERGERKRLADRLESMDREIQLRADIHDQNAVLEVQTRYLDAIAKRTGSVPMMTSARQPPIKREDPPSDPPTDSPIPPPLPPMRGRLPSTRGR